MAPTFDSIYLNAPSMVYFVQCCLTSAPNRSHSCLFACRCWPSNTQDDSNYTPLMKAATNGHTECVRLLLEAGAAVNAKTWVRNHSVIIGCAVVNDCFDWSCAVFPVLSCSRAIANHLSNIQNYSIHSLLSLLYWLCI